MKAKTRVGIFGFGKTGKLVANEFALDSNFELSWIVRKSAIERHQPSSHLLGLHEEFGTIYQAQEIDERFYDEHPVDVIVDFAHPDAMYEYAAAAKRGIKIITAISHYSDTHIETLQAWSAGTAVLYSPNITLGINCLLIASQILQQIAPHADIEIVEEHFREKGSPSGTAVKIAQALSLNSNEKVHSIRVGGIIGTHEIIFGLPNQTIRLIHESFNRAAFGQGAIFAAQWLKDQRPGFYSMEQIISDMFRNNVPVY